MELPTQRFEGGGLARALFMIVCWELWRRQNLVIFEGKSMHNDQIIITARAILSSSLKTRGQLEGTTIGGACTELIREAWQPPMAGWIKVNVDGAYSHRHKINACGGLIRKALLYVKSFIQRIDEGDEVTAELWGLLHGLKLAWDDGHRRV